MQVEDSAGCRKSIWPHLTTGTANKGKGASQNVVHVGVWALTSLNFETRRKCFDWARTRVCIVTIGRSNYLVKSD